VIPKAYLNQWATRARQHREIRDELAEREVQAPGTWAIRAFAARPTQPHTRKQWEQAVRRAARYRYQYDITDLDTPLGNLPEDRKQHHDWKRADENIQHTAECLSRESPTTTPAM
jgi:hypothetical protein